MPAKEPLPKGWNEKNGRLSCGYKFKDFKAAMAFLNQVAMEAESQGHHPDFTVHWNEVRFEVWSHDEGKITFRDHKLVTAIAALADMANGKRFA